MYLTEGWQLAKDLRKYVRFESTMKPTLLSILILAIACKSAMKTIETSTDPAKNKLVELLQSSTEMQRFIQNKDELNIQVIYTKIDRNSKGQPIFTDYTFNVDGGRYFYPASTVKMPVSFLALEKINELKQKGIDKYTSMVTDSSFSGQEVSYTHPSAQESKASIAHYVKQIFLVSDNDAFNRLYEFLGQENIYNKLKQKGFNNSVIRHRLAVFLSQEQNRHTNPVSFYDTAGNVLYEQPAQYSNVNFPAADIRIGKGYYSGNKLVNEPFDFSLKNNVSLQDLHQQLRTFIFPASVKKEQRYNINEEDRQFVLRWMSSYPRESRYPYYDTVSYPDDYTKFLGSKIISNRNVRIFSKAGWAYGYLTDVAYVIDLKNNIEFMLSATILNNSDGIFNDDKYDFETTGIPFMASLGQLVYQHELNRKRTGKADLSSFRFDYTKE